MVVRARETARQMRQVPLPLRNSLPWMQQAPLQIIQLLHVIFKRAAHYARELPA